MRKTVLPLLMVCICFICSCFVMTASAETKCIVSGENVMAVAGSTVTMEISIANNPGVCGIELEVSYGEGLTLVGAESGEAFSALSYGAPFYFRNPTTFLWESEIVDEADVKDGTILTLTFEVDLAAEGDLPVQITCKEAYDNDLNAVDVTTMNAIVNVIAYLPGDVNGDTLINTQDITMIRRYISDGRITNPNGYNVSLNENAADVNADANISALDITLIRRFISDGRVTNPDGYNVTLKPGKMACAHHLEHTEAKEPTCTEAGNTEYWYCTKCEKYFADDEAKYQILQENTQLKPDHTYATQLSFDESAHWYDASCEHVDQIKDQEDHNFENHRCSICGAEETFLVTFMDDEGVVLDTQLVPFGGAATAPAAPDRRSYLFAGWDTAFDVITEELTVTAQYEKGYEVYFADIDGRFLKGVVVRPGGSAIPYVFTEEDTMPEGYDGFERVGWDKSYENITEDTIIYAQYTLKKYTVNFYMPDGTLIDTQIVEHGADAVEPTCNENYFDWTSLKMGAFSGWSKSLKNIENGDPIYAQYANEHDAPVFSIETTKNSASIKMYAPAGCYLYAIDFGFDWTGNISILSCDTNIASNLYKGNGAYNIDYSNKYDNFHYTWTNAAGVKLEGAYTTVLDIQFVTDGDQVVSKDVLKLFENCSIIFSMKQTGNMDELETVTPVIMMK